MDRLYLYAIEDSLSEGARLLNDKITEGYARLSFGYWCFMALIASVFFVGTGRGIAFFFAISCPWIGFIVLWEMTRKHANG